MTVTRFAASRAHTGTLCVRGHADADSASTRWTMAEHPTTSWQAMQDGNAFYRQQRLYTLDGKLPSLGDCIVAGCRNGGPLGTLALACHHKEVHWRINSAHEGYKKNDCYWAYNTYILKVTNSCVLTFRRGLTAAQRTCRLPGSCAHFLCW